MANSYKIYIMPATCEISSAVLWFTDQWTLNEFDETQTYQTPKGVKLETPSTKR